jgi:hypothetical protein
MDIRVHVRVVHAPDPVAERPDAATIEALLRRFPDEKRS